MKNKFFGEWMELMGAKVSAVTCVGNSNTSTQMRFRDIISNVSKTEIVQKAKEMKGWKHTEKADKYKERKSMLPAFSLTTYGEDRESTRNFPKELRNPYIIIDVDNVEVNEEMLHKLNSLPFVLCTGVSLSGEGYYSIVKISNVYTEQDFKGVFKQLERVYKELGIEIDKSCSNLNRLRIISPYELVWNEDNFIEAYKYERDDEDFNTNTCVNSGDNIKPIELDSFIINDSPYNKIVEPYKKGDMYTTRISWANTIYNIYGESGYSLYMEIMKEQPDKNEINSIWNQAKKGYSSSSYCIKKLISNGYLINKVANDMINDLF